MKRTIAVRLMKRDLEFLIDELKSAKCPIVEIGFDQAAKDKPWRWVKYTCISPIEPEHSNPIKEGK